MLMQLTIDAVHWSATYIANGKRAKAILRTDVLGSFIFIAPRAGQLVKEHAANRGYHRTCDCPIARPGLVLASISSMFAAVIVLALRVTLGSS